jgi:ABC-type phosphate/phosphonate transport system substrate-binding protein
MIIPEGALAPGPSRRGRGYFGHTIAACVLLLAGEIDATAIDIGVLEAELQRHPKLAECIRIVATLGPSPVSPWVIHHRVSEELRAAVRSMMLDMHHNPSGPQLLATEPLADS